MHQTKIFRAAAYTAGMFILALGLTLNTKTGLGVSPLISVPYCISELFSLNFGDTTLAAYCVFVAMQFLLRGKQARIIDLLQIPLSLLFTRVLNLYSALLPIAFSAFWQNLLLLAAAILFTGVGAAMTLDMRLVPNPGDGIVQAIADRFGLETGLAKNLFDLICVSIALGVGFAFGRPFCGIGVGTALAVLLVGRVIALFNRLFKPALIRRAGMQ